MERVEHISASSAGNVIVTKQKTLFSTSNPFEERFGYYRAVRRGPFIAISGTTAVRLPEEGDAGDKDSNIWYPQDAYKQAKLAMDRANGALGDLGGKSEDIVRVRMYVANHNDCNAVGQAFKEIFAKQGDLGQHSSDGNDMVGTAATMVVVPGGLVDKDMLVEIEVDAYSCPTV